MRFKLGMTVEKMLIAYDVPISKEIPTEFLKQKLGVYGVLTDDYFSDNKETDKKIMQFLESPKFIKRTQEMQESLTEYPQPEGWINQLELYYDNEGNIDFTSDIWDDN